MKKELRKNVGVAVKLLDKMQKDSYFSSNQISFVRNIDMACEKLGEAVDAIFEDCKDVMQSKEDGANGRAHSAVNDAEDTALAYYNMKAKKINKELLKEINTHKYNVKIYRANRSVKLATIKRPEAVTDDFINRLEAVFKNAASTVDTSIITAVHDDMMRIIGRPDLETGEENL